MSENEEEIVEFQRYTLIECPKCKHKTRHFSVRHKVACSACGQVIYYYIKDGQIVLTTKRLEIN